jgi:hypothetical protein
VTATNGVLRALALAEQPTLLADVYYLLAHSDDAFDQVQALNLLVDWTRGRSLRHHLL